MPAYNHPRPALYIVPEFFVLREEHDVLPPPTDGTGAGKTEKVWWYLLKTLPFFISFPQQDGQEQTIPFLA